MKKQLLSAALVLAMLAGMAGCGQAPAASSTAGEKSEVGESSAAADDSSTAEESKEGEATGDAPVIKVANTTKGSADMTVWPPEFMKQINKDLGIQLELVQVTEDQFDLSLASGDASYDIANATKYREQQVLNANMAVNLDEYLDKVGTNLKKYENSNNMVREFLSNGTGNLYFTRCQIGPEAPGKEVWGGYVVRWDWYKELGCPPMNSDEDYLNVLKQMVEAHPENDAGNSTYGLGQYVGTGLWSWTVTQTSRQAYADVVKGLQLDLKTGKTHNAYTDEKSSYWKSMEFYNKAYNMGLLDPDFFTMKQDDLTQKVVQGTYAGGLRTWDMTEYYTQESAKDPNTMKGYISVFPEKGGMAAYYGCDPMAGWENNSIFVYSKCANIEKAVSFLDYMANEDNMRTFYSGFKGTDWDVIDGIPAMTEAGLKLFSEGGQNMDNSGLHPSTTGGWMAYYCPLEPYVKHSDGSMLGLSNEGSTLAKSLNPLQKDYSDYYKVEYPAQVHEKQVEAGTAINRKEEPKDLYMVLGEVPSDMAALDTQLAALVEGYIPNLVTAATAEEFNAVKDQVIAECKSAGSDELFTYADGAYQKAKKTWDDAKAKYGIK